MKLYINNKLMEEKKESIVYVIENHTNMATGNMAPGNQTQKPRVLQNHSGFLLCKEQSVLDTL